MRKGNRANKPDEESDGGGGGDDGIASTNQETAWASEEDEGTFATRPWRWPFCSRWTGRGGTGESSARTGKYSVCGLWISVIFWSVEPTGLGVGEDGQRRQWGPQLRP